MEQRSIPINVKWPNRFFESDPFIKALFDFIPDAVLIINAEGKIIYSNAQACTLFGYDNSEFKDLTVENIIPQRFRENHIALRKEYDKYPIMRPMGRKLELFGLTKDCEEIPVDISLSPIQTENGFLYLALVRDVSELKKANYELIKLNDMLGKFALCDALTKLPNRKHFYETLAREMSRADRRHSNIAVLYIDLDKFKPVNDSSGHLMGDKILIRVAERFKSILRQSDFIARLGGDEFVALIGDITDKQQATIIAKKIIAEVCIPFEVDGHNIQLGASIGIALYPEQGNDIESLIKHADNAMYVAKEKGGNTYQFSK